MEFPDWLQPKLFVPKLLKASFVGMLSVIFKSLMGVVWLPLFLRLFAVIVYINDLPIATEVFEAVLFADRFDFPVGIEALAILFRGYGSVEFAIVTVLFTSRVVRLLGAFILRVKRLEVCEFVNVLLYLQTTVVDFLVQVQSGPVLVLLLYVHPVGRLYVISDPAASTFCNNTLFSLVIVILFVYGWPASTTLSGMVRAMLKSRKPRPAKAEELNNNIKAKLVIIYLIKCVRV